MKFVDEVADRTSGGAGFRFPPRAWVTYRPEAAFRVEAGYLRINVRGIYLRIPVEHVEEHQLDGIAAARGTP